jgi:hypothetical protein
MDLFSPAYGDDISHFFLLLIVRVEDAAQLGNLSVDLFASDGRLELSEALPVTKVPHLACAIATRCDETSLGLIEAPSSNFLLHAMGITKLGHELSIFNVPHSDEATVIC